MQSGHLPIKDSITRLIGAMLLEQNADDDGPADLAEAGFYQAVLFKSFDSMLTRMLVADDNNRARFRIEPI